jgi:NhaP-type Na+/H+ or K+/H+ antiporter
MSAVALFPAAIALVVGMIAQAVAARLAVPSIVLLLGLGALVGPDALGLLDPSVFGRARADLVSLAVTVILFEGGLALDVSRLRQQQRSLLLLLTVGAAMSMAGGMLAARAFLEMSWSVAALYGSIMIVTGPTVVTPLLSRLTVNRRVRELLISEGVLIDPIGAIVAIVAVEYVVGQHAALASGWLVFWRLVVGGAVGAVGGFVLAVLLRRRLIAEELVNPFVLGAVLLVAASASQLSAEAGLMAAVVQGVVLANARLRELRRLREFKEALTVLLLSFIFVVLAADLPLADVAALGWGALAVVGTLVWVVRPLGVFVATIGSSLTPRERLFVAWICPRGIVAAAVAAFFRLLLIEAEIPGGSQLEALVFVTVALTVTVQGLTAGWVARLLGVDVLTLRGTIVVGADRFGRLIARLLTGQGRQVALIDRSVGIGRTAREEGFSVYEGDALAVETLDEAGARYADTVVAMTRNTELNTLVAQQVRDNYSVERILAVTGPHTATNKDEGKPVAFPGNFPGIDEVNRLLRLNQTRIVVYQGAEDGEGANRKLGELPYAAGEFALLHGRGTAILIATSESRLGPGDLLWCLQPLKTTSPLADTLTLLQEFPARTGAASG